MDDMIDFACSETWLRYYAGKGMCHDVPDTGREVPEIPLFNEKEYLASLGQRQPAKPVEAKRTFKPLSELVPKDWSY
jgi:hypothetical protein